MKNFTLLIGFLLCFISVVHGQEKLDTIQNTYPKVSDIPTNLDGEYKYVWVSELETWVAVASGPSKYERNKKKINKAAVVTFGTLAAIGGAVTILCYASENDPICLIFAGLGFFYGALGGGIILGLAHPINWLLNRDKGDSSFGDLKYDSRDIKLHIGIVDNGFGMRLKF